MAADPTAPAPGSMTVPPLSGWEDVVPVLASLVLLAVAFLVLGAAGAALNGRSEWQAYLSARSRSRRLTATDPPDR